MSSLRPSRSHPWRSLVAGLLLCLGTAVRPRAIAAGQPPAVHLGTGATFVTLQVGKTSYQQVKVRSVNARALIISHAGGLAKVLLHDLSPELQTAFGYPPGIEATGDSSLKEARNTPGHPMKKPPGPSLRTVPSGESPFEGLLQSFGRLPELRPSVDLRPALLDFGLDVKNQGRRPSCAVFAIVSALEYQNAQLTGQPERFSEEYLIWATCKLLNRAPHLPTAPASSDGETPESSDQADEGFTLAEVVTALRTYGIPLRSRMPNLLVDTMAADPPDEVVEEARSHRRVSVFALPGRDQTARLANLIQSLNAGIPVAAGLLWPSWRALRGSYLSEQKPAPDGGHAVTIVGYENATGTIADTVFIFKNSWGVHWGTGGYGHVTYGYLSRNLNDTALLEVARGNSP